MQIEAAVRDARSPAAERAVLCIVANVRTKEAALTGAPPPPLEPHRQAVLDWYFEHRLGLMCPPSLAAFLTEAGWEDENELMLAVWRDYLFNRIPK